MPKATVKTCETCGAEFVPVKPWQKFCTQRCRPRKLIWSTCKLDVCDKPARGADAYCAMHRERILRHGSPDVTLRHRNPAGSVPEPSELSVKGPGRAYVRFKSPGHPLADTQGTVAVHRWVLFERIGPGEHPCHWCGTPVRWMKGLSADALIADHIDANPRNNDPANLVQSCQGCNALRNGHPNSRKTHCPQGHPYDVTNTYITPSTGDRLCRECIRTRNRERMRELRRKALAS